MFIPFLLESYQSEQVYYRGLTQPHDENYHNHIIWVSSNENHANEYATSNISDKSKPTILKYKIDSKTPVDFGYRNSTVVTTDKEFLDRVKQRVLDAYSNKQVDKNTAKTAFDTIHNIPTNNEYKQVWEFRDNIPQVKHIMKQVGYDSFTDTENHQGENVNTVGLFDKSQLQKIEK